MRQRFLGESLHRMLSQACHVVLCKPAEKIRHPLRSCPSDLPERGSGLGCAQTGEERALNVLDNWSR